MPSQIDHRRQAEWNEQFASDLVQQNSPRMDWAVTACFYAALHLVDEYLAGFGIAPELHGKRKGLIQLYLTPILKDYHLLQRCSEDARYECVQMNPIIAFQPADVQSLLDGQLKNIKDYLANLP